MFQLHLHTVAGCSGPGGSGRLCRSRRRCGCGAGILRALPATWLTAGAGAAQVWLLPQLMTCSTWVHRAGCCADVPYSLVRGMRHLLRPLQQPYQRATVTARSLPDQRRQTSTRWPCAHRFPLVPHEQPRYSVFTDGEAQQTLVWVTFKHDRKGVVRADICCHAQHGRMFPWMMGPLLL